MLNFPFDALLQRNQPLVTLDGDVHVVGRRPEGPATLVSALGASHPLRRLASVAELRRRHAANNQPAVATLLRQEAGAAAHARPDALAYFIEHVAPGLRARDWDELEPGAPAAGRGPVAPCLEELVAKAAADVPFPAAPAWGLWVFGRVWLLGPMPGQAGRMHVRVGERALGLTGEYLRVSTLESEWRAEVGSYVRQAAGRLVEAVPSSGETDATREARQVVKRQGAYQVGDLLYIQGNPPRLGHILPPHYNRVLGRESRRDLAMTAPLTMPPKISAPSVYQRDAAGRWVPCPLPNGLCLGGGPPADRPTSPGLALAAFLRWAAVRIAVNGIFHVQDDTSSSEDTYDNY